MTFRYEPENRVQRSSQSRRQVDCQGADGLTSASARADCRTRKAGVMPHEFGVFVRSMDQLDRAQAAAKEAEVAFKVLDKNVETTSGHISIGTMHLAKGLEFRAVAVMACDDEIIPLEERIDTVGDNADLQVVYDTERHSPALARLYPRSGSPAGSGGARDADARVRTTVGGHPHLSVQRPHTRRAGLTEGRNTQLPCRWY
jgi:hypothetical protein